MTRDPRRLDLLEWTLIAACVFTAGALAWGWIAPLERQGVAALRMLAGAM